MQISFRRVKGGCISLVSFLLLVGSACISAGQSSENENFGNINVETARQMIEENKNNPDFVLLDTRTPREFERSRIEGAQFYNYSSREFWDQIKNLDKSKTYLVYCHSGGRSGNTVKFMEKNGFKEAYNVRGGILSWKKAGLPIK
jgi:rhodanese-related sulfurtransferase